MYGREDDGHSSTSSRYQPADATHAPTAATDRSSRVRSGAAAHSRYAKPKLGNTRTACSILARKPKPTAAPAPTIHHRLAFCSHARCTQYAPATNNSTSSASGLLKRNINAATGVSAKTVPANSAAEGPLARRTAA